MKKSASLKHSYYFFCVVLFFIPVFVFPQSQPIEDFLLNAYVGVRIDKGPDQMTADLAPIEIQYPGYYRLYPNMVHDSGDEQLNESYFLTVHNEDGTVSTPVDSNAGPYKVVPDIPGFSKPLFEDAGLFYFKPGISIIKLHHYAEIYKDYPQFLNPPMGGTTQHSQAESVYIQDSLSVIAEPLTDGLLDSKVITPRIKLYNNDRRQVAYPGENVTITLRVQNIYLNDIRFAKLIGTLPDSLVPLSFSIAPKDTNHNRYLWDVPQLSPNDSFTVSIVGKLPPKMPKGYTLLELPAKLTAPNDIDSTNNVTSPSFWALADSSGDPPQEMADLKISLFSHTDSLLTVNGDTTKFAFTDETFDYSLIVNNLSADTAKKVIVSGKLSELIDLQNTPIVAQYRQGDSLAWTYDRVLPYEQKVIPFVVKVKKNLVSPDSMIISRGYVTADNDTLPLNNTDSDTVRVAKRPPAADLTLSLLAETERSTVINGKTEKVVLRGETYSVQLNVQNNGPDPATDVTLWTLIPDSVSLSAFNIDPSLTSEDTLFWTFNSITTETPVTINFSAQVSDSVPGFPYKLVHPGFVQSPLDKLTGNNGAQDSVFVIETEPPPQNTDVAITLNSATDTTITIQNKEWNAVKPGRDYNYVIELNNLGVQPAQTIQVVQKLPENVIFKSASFVPAQQISDSLLWDLSELGANSDSSWQVTVTLPDNVPDAVKWLYSSVHLSAVNDTTDNNNTDRDTVAVVSKYPPVSVKTDLAVTLASITDSSVTEQGREWNAVKPGPDFQYKINLQNLGPNKADSVLVIQKLPADVTYKSSDFTPFLQRNDSLFWKLVNYPATKDSTWLVTSTLSGDVPDTRDWLYSSVELFSANDSTALNNTDNDTIKVIHKPPVTDKNFDAALTFTAVTDTQIVVNNNTFPAVVAGGSFQYRLQVKNNGANHARLINLNTIVPDILELSEFSTIPVLSNDSLFWNIDTLDNQSIWTVTFTAQTPDSFTVLPFELNANALISAPLDTFPDNDESAVRVYVVQKQIPGEIVDVLPDQFAVTDSFALSGGDTLKFAAEGETYLHYLILKNAGNKTAENVTVVNYFPDSVTVSNINPPPLSVDQDSSVWVFESLAPNGKIVISFEATVPGLMPVGTNALVNRLYVGAENETENRKANNSSIYSVYNFVKTPEPFTPEIEVIPTAMDVTDSALVRVKAPVTVTDWDLWVYWPDGQVIKTFADDFIQRNKILQPDIWYDIDDMYNHPSLVSLAEQDQILFEIRATDRRGAGGTAQATLIVRSGDHLVLDRNVYQPDIEDYVDIRFKLGYRRLARLDVYDVSGRRITKLTEDIYNGGWNSYLWNGIMENGRKVGSGVYLITLQSGEFKDWKKLIIVR